MTQPSQPRYLPALRFHWLTPCYDLLVGATREQRVKKALISQARPQPGQQILDLGCGTGTLALWLKQHQPLAEVTGVDCDPAILSIARAKADKGETPVPFACAMSDHLPYPAHSFDSAVSSLFFHHLTWPDKERTTQELFRVLKPGAEVHVADWGKPSSALMRCLILFEQLYDGFARTRDNVAGRLPVLFEQCGFIEVSKERSFDTIFGTLALYRARKPD